MTTIKTFDITKHKNKIVPGNVYRIYGDIHGWPDNFQPWKRNAESFTMVYAWSDWVIEAKRRGFTDETIEYIYDNYWRDGAFFTFETVDNGDFSWMCYNEYGESMSLSAKDENSRCYSLIVNP